MVKCYHIRLFNLPATLTLDSVLLVEANTGVKYSLGLHMPRIGRGLEGMGSDTEIIINLSLPNRYYSTIEFDPTWT